MGTNIKGVFNVCRAIIPVTSTRRSIINIGSISGGFANPSMALYVASKVFVHGLSISIAVDHGPDLRCNVIAPGWIETGILEAGFNLATELACASQDAVERHATRRFGQLQDIAKIASWLASDAASFVTGQIFTVHDGLTAASPIKPTLT